MKQKHLRGTHSYTSHTKPTLKTKKQKKIHKVMDEFKHHQLHSGSKNGPIVTNPKQAIAIAIQSSRKLKKKH
jgi:hypothetical protein